MGRTLPTYRNLLEEEVSRWKPFKRALRREDQEAFDELMNMCREHSSAASYTATTQPFETMTLSMLLEIWKTLREIEKTREIKPE